MSESTFGLGARVERRSEDSSLILPEGEDVLFSHTGFELALSLEDAEREEVTECRKIEGEVVVTNRRVLFLVPELAVEADNDDDEDDDDEEATLDDAFNLSVDASSIGLFALSNNNEDEDENTDADADADAVEATGIAGQCLFVQCAVPVGGGDSSRPQPVELYLYPIGENVEEKEKLLQRLFEALSETAELNCPEEDDDDDDDDDDGFYMRADDDDDGAAADDDARDALLTKLDNLLVVPPELEKGADGQFDDADDDDDDKLL